MGVTIKDIATMAGVSRGTVDKVLNQRPGVKKETREKVLKIIKEMNYQPNFIGKALVQSKDSIKIGIILTPDYRLLKLSGGAGHCADHLQLSGFRL